MDETRRIKPAMLTETNFRSLAAVAFRRDGMTFKEIGARLGVGPSRARSLFERGERILVYSPAFRAIAHPDTRPEGV